MIKFIQNKIETIFEDEDNFIDEFFEKLKDISNENVEGIYDILLYNTDKKKIKRRLSSFI